MTFKETRNGHIPPNENDRDPPFCQLVLFCARIAVLRENPAFAASLILPVKRRQKQKVEEVASPVHFFSSGRCTIGKPAADLQTLSTVSCTINHRRCELGCIHGNIPALPVSYALAKVTRCSYCICYVLG